MTDNTADPLDPVIKSANRTIADAKVTARDAKRTVDAGRTAAPEVAKRARKAVDEQVDTVRTQAAEQLETARQLAQEQLDIARELAEAQIENARVYVKEQVTERPLTSTLVAVGVGFMLGMLFTGSRR